MQIIPVIDLKDGQVVHAAGGDRSRYQPVHRTSLLCGSSEITAVVAGFLNLYPFQTFYIADLDAISRRGNHDEAIACLPRAYPGVELWLDNGGSYNARNDSRSHNIKMVIGTESQAQPDYLPADLILSLDFKHNQALGHPGWLERPECWPDTVIVMTLDLVGGNHGPDFEKLGKLCNKHPDKRIVAAGGVRDIKDLMQLKTMGIAAVLLASALHNGSIGAATLEKFQAKKYPGKPGYF